MDMENVTDDRSYAVAAIVGKRMQNDKIEYLVKWTGFADCDNSWEPVSNLNCAMLIAKFERENRDSPLIAMKQNNGMKKARGRPRRIATAEPPVKRPRGRPRKNPESGTTMRQVQANGGRSPSITKPPAIDDQIATAAHQVDDPDHDRDKRALVNGGALRLVSNNVFDSIRDVEDVICVQRRAGVVHYVAKLSNSNGDGTPSTIVVPAGSLIARGAVEKLVEFYEQRLIFANSPGEETVETAIGGRF